MIFWIVHLKTFVLERPEHIKNSSKILVNTCSTRFSFFLIFFKGRFAVSWTNCPHRDPFPCAGLQVPPFSWPLCNMELMPRLGFVWISMSLVFTTAFVTAIYLPPPFGGLCVNFSSPARVTSCAPGDRQGLSLRTVISIGVHTSEYLVNSRIDVKTIFVRYFSMNWFGIELVLCNLYPTRFDLTKDLSFDTFFIAIFYK